MISVAIKIFQNPWIKKKKIEFDLYNLIKKAIILKFLCKVKPVKACFFFTVDNAVFSRYTYNTWSSTSCPAVTFNTTPKKKEK